MTLDGGPSVSFEKLCCSNADSSIQVVQVP